MIWEYRKNVEKLRNMFVHNYQKNGQTSLQTKYFGRD